MAVLVRRTAATSHRMSATCEVVEDICLQRNARILTTTTPRSFNNHNNQQPNLHRQQTKHLPPATMVNLISLIAPISYIAVLLGSLIAFSSLYRKRKNAKAASLEPWFPPHTARDVYLSLLHQDEESSVPDTLLKAALMLRAKEDIRRLMVLRTSKSSLQSLLQKGCVGDDLWTRFSRAESEMEEVSRVC